MEAIDLYHPARVDPAVPYEDTIGAVADLIKEGKVRYLGISEANADQIRKAHSVHPVTALQIEYSLATRMIEPKILPLARELGIGIVAYGVMSRGLLTADVTVKYGPEDFRAYLPRFQGDNFAKNMEKVNLLQKMASEKGCTAAQLSIAWALSKGQDIVPLIGTSNRTRLSQNLKALEIALSADEISKLDRAFTDGTIAGDRYPTQQMGIVAK